MTHKILVLPGDGIGPEIVAEAAKVLECLLNGWDDIELTLRHADEIRAYEARRRQQAPWLFS